jgi:flagellar protein FlbT
MAKMRFSLKAGERIFINGAVLTVDSRVKLTLLNDARFLLESHVLQVEQATTPLRQLYFVVQAILIDPAGSEKAIEIFRDLQAAMLINYTDEEIREGLRAAAELVEADHPFEALKILRNLFYVDDGEPRAPSVGAVESHAAA